MAHAFFASYARDDDARLAGRQLLSEVVAELRTRVAQRLGLGPDDKVCFFDTESIETADDWERRLGTEVNEARVLVCFCSPNFVNRPYCAKEFEVFRRRLALVRDEPPMVVVPVMWRLLDPFPAALDRYQRFSAAFPPHYRQAGLFKLAELASRRDELSETLEALADVIAKRVKESVVLKPLDAMPRFDELPQGFDNPAVDLPTVAVAFLHDQGPTWRLDPFNPETALRELVDRATRKRGLAWSHLVLAGEPPNMADTAAVLAIGTAEQLNSWRPYLELIDDAQLVLGVRADGVGGQAGAVEFRLDGDAAKSFNDTLTALLTKIYLTAINSRRAAARVEDVALAAKAADRGVDVKTRPGISGQGGA